MKSDYPSQKLARVLSECRSGFRRTLRFDNDWNDHWSTAMLLAHPLADSPANKLLKLVGVSHAVAHRILKPSRHPRNHVIENIGCLSEPAGLNFGTGHDLCRQPRRPQRIRNESSSPRMRRS